jgi:hypothetical protein
MEKTGQGLQVMPHIGKNDLELLVIVRAREPNPLHALINCHGWSLPAGLAQIGARFLTPMGASRILTQIPDQRSLFGDTSCRRIG